MQRLSVDDLTGYILANEAENWEHVKYQGLDEDSETALWPEKVPATTLLEWKKLLPFFYYSQYQQEPIILGGAVIKREWFGYYPVNVQYDYKRIFIVGDTAMKVKQHNDYNKSYYHGSYESRFSGFFLLFFYKNALILNLNYYIIE